MMYMSRLQLIARKLGRSSHDTRGVSGSCVQMSGGRVFLVKRDHPMVSPRSSAEKVKSLVARLIVNGTLKPTRLRSGPPNGDQRGSRPAAWRILRLSLILALKPEPQEACMENCLGEKRVNVKEIHEIVVGKVF